MISLRRRALKSDPHPFGSSSLRACRGGVSRTLAHRGFLDFGSRQARTCARNERFLFNARYPGRFASDCLMQTIRPSERSAGLIASHDRGAESDATWLRDRDVSLSTAPRLPRQRDMAAWSRLPLHALLVSLNGPTRASGSLIRRREGRSCLPDVRSGLCL